MKKEFKEMLKERGRTEMPNVLLVSITHGAASQIANGDSVFQQGDIVLVVTNGREVLYQPNDIFA